MALGVCTAALAGAGQSTGSAERARRRSSPRRRPRPARRCTGSRAPSCHGATLTGGTAPALTGPAFEASWGNPRVTLADIFFIARTTMPPRASSSLTPQDHAAVFAYILKANGFPSGASALTAASETAGGARAFAPDGARAPERAAPPAFIAGAPGAAPAATGPDQATLNGAAQSTDWLFHTHDYAGTRFSPLQEINTTTVGTPCAGVHVPGRRARQFPDRPDRLQRHDVRDDDDQHHRARCGDVPGEVAPSLADARRPGVPAQSRRRDQGRPRRARQRPTATCSR